MYLHMFFAIHTGHGSQLHSKAQIVLRYEIETPRVTYRIVCTVRFKKVPVKAFARLVKNPFNSVRFQLNDPEDTNEIQIVEEIQLEDTFGSV